MKNLLLTAALLLTATACGNKGYTITGTLPDSSANGKQAYLYDVNAQQGVYMDSVVIDGNKYVFTGIFPDSLNTCYSIIVPQFASATIIPENENITVEYAANQTPLSNSSKINGIFNTFLKEKQAIDNRARVIVDSLKEIYVNDRDGFFAAYNTIVQPLFEQYNNVTKTYMHQNKENLLGTYLMCDMMYEAQNLKQFDSLASIVPAAAEFRQMTILRQRLENIEKTQNGAMYVDFNGKNLDGTSVKLSDYVGKGKYVLVDFWASWCGPCKGEIPNLKMLHNNYKDLVVLGVNVWDKDEAFRNALQEEGMTWAQIYASDNQDATNAYGIQGIPTIILFAPDGTIVDRTLRGEAMIAKIGELFPAVKVGK